MSDPSSGGPVHDTDDAVHKTKSVEAAGWGLFLVWIGIATLFALGWPIILIGLGVLALATQALRRKWGLGTETFWLVLGVVFIAAGVFESVGTRFPLVPTALILFGLVAIYSAYRRLSER